MDELVRAYQLNDNHRSKIVCPKEILMRESEVVQPFDDEAIKAAQKVAGECLWLSQRTRIDIAFSTTMLCSKVSKDPHGAIEIGRRILHYLHQTKDFKLHLKPVKDVAPLRVFTDASFAPLGQHSYGGHVVEVKGVPALWKASRQQLISLSSSEAELVQAVEGCMYAESLMTILVDLGIQCESAELCLDNTAAIAFVNGSGSQRTRHLKVRGYKIRQLIQSGWTVSHCPGEYQKADLLTKTLPSVRLQFLCRLLQLGGDATAVVTPRPEVRSVGALPSSLSKVLMLLQVCKCCGELTDDSDDKGGVSIEWPWELAVLTVLIVLSTLFLWEAAGAPCRRRQPSEPQIRAVSVEKERRARKLQGRVSAAIEAALSESPTGDEAQPRARGRNKCPGVGDESRGESAMPTVVYGGINMHIPPAQPTTAAQQGYSQPSASPQLPVEARGSQQRVAAARPSTTTTGFRPDGHEGLGRDSVVWEPKRRVAESHSSSTQTDPVIVLDPSEYVYVSGRGDCVQKDQDCHGLRRAFDIRPKAVCQYCLNRSKGAR